MKSAGGRASSQEFVRHPAKLCLPTARMVSARAFNATPECHARFNV
jgi:hypothetical protein